MAELDAASIFLIILAVAIAPWVLPVILRAMAAEKEEIDEFVEEERTLQRRK